MEIFAYVTKISSSPQKPLYITMNSSISSINFHLGLILEVEDCMCMIVYIIIAMNTSNKDYHLWVMS